MNIYVYSDESGVLDKIHNEYYVYGGLIFLDKNSRDMASRKYSSIENHLSLKYPDGIELKASMISGNHKRRLFSATNNCIRFGGIVEQGKINDRIFSNKKSKQRYLDYVYKISLKNALITLEKRNELILDDVERIIIYADEHTTATNGIYELHESIYQEFSVGTLNFEYNTSFPPITKNLKDVDLNLCDSKKHTLVKAADIIANTVYKSATKGQEPHKSIIIKWFP